MTKQEKIMIFILFNVILISNLLIFLWLIKDIKESYKSFTSDIILGPLAGLITGIYVTIYYRKKDKNERTAYASYGLQVHLKKIGHRLDDLITDERNNDFQSWLIDIDKLRETLIEEPYTVFLDLDDRSLDEEYRKSRIPAAMVISQIESMIVYDRLWPSLKEMVQFRSDIFQARSHLLRLSSRFRKPKWLL